MRQTLLATSLFTFVLAGSTACATKGYVNEQMGQMSEKVDSLGQSLEETQEKTRENEGRIGEVDAKAEGAQGSADRAQQAANAADGRAGAAGDAARAAGMKADELEAASRRLIYEVVLSEDQGNFEFGAAELPDAAKARIDELITEIKADPQGFYFEIEGHTDSTGPAEVNKRLGMERADAVKMYLYEQHQIPLHRMNVVSFGEDKPIDDNGTREGRAKNRRVVLRVLV